MTAAAARAATPAAQAQCGRLWAWGANHLGQMGAGPGFDQLAPLPVPGLPPVRAVCANASAVLALDGDGRVWSWGWNTRGMLGRGRPTDEKAYWLPTVLRDRGHRNLDPAGNPPEMPGMVPQAKPMTTQPPTLRSTRNSRRCWTACP